MGPDTPVGGTAQRNKEAEKMRKELFSVSILMLALVSFECYGSELFYLALFSSVPLIYAYIKEKKAPLFPPILGAAFVMNAFTYQWDVSHILLLSLIWPGIFALFALHSVPESKDMEKSVFMAWTTAFFISASFLYLVPAMISSIPNPIALALIGLMAGIALAFLAWK